MAGNTGFWWWPYVHFADYYEPFVAVRKFMKMPPAKKAAAVGAAVGAAVIAL